MEKVNNKMMNFIDNTPNAYCCVKNIKEELNKKGYKELFENQEWDIKKGNKML